MYSVPHVELCVTGSHSESFDVALPQCELQGFVGMTSRELLDGCGDAIYITEVDRIA
jgi:hypothetical protein